MTIATFFLLCQFFDQAGATIAESGDGIVFASRRLEVELKPGDWQAELRFEFTNHTGVPLAVEGFSQSCGCLSGQWDGTPVDPGQTGNITAKFLTQGQRGTVTKSLLVKFVGFETIELSATVTIPESMTFSARTLRWSKGAKAEARTIDIAVNTRKPVRVLSIKGDSAFDTELVTLEDGRRYRIAVTPKNTDAERVGIFQVRTDAPDPRDALHGVFAMIEPIPPASEDQGGLK